MESYGFYSKTQQKICGRYVIYDTPTGVKISVTEVVDLPNLEVAENYFYNDYKMRFPDGVFRGPVREFIETISTDMKMRPPLRPIFGKPTTSVGRSIVGQHKF